MSSTGGPIYQTMIEQSAAGRVGTTDAVASAAQFLLGAEFITGSGLLMDGGVIAAICAQRVNLQL